ncbi:hypothetical protein K1719_041079 [Acacia pycnantha]|nr:hypothetical protein K1719_041079 [Acacia pycnantha]
MGLPKAVAFARNFTVMVRVRGPDSKGSGETTLSTSGMLIPANLYDTEVAKHLYGDLCEGMCLVVTVASIFEPFLSPQQRENVSQKISEKTDKGIPWPEAQLLSLVDIPASAHCLQSLVESSFCPPVLGWEVGWSLIWHLTLMILSIQKIFYKLSTKQVNRSTCKFDSMVCKPESTII